jgi:hypothetical protein
LTRSLSRSASISRLLEFKIHRPFKNGEMQGSEKIQGAQCIERCAVWIFSLTQQIAILGRPVRD